MSTTWRRDTCWLSNVGAIGRSYIIGGENLGMGAFLAALADCTNLPAPTRQVPRAVALGVGALSQLIEGRLLRREPSVALEAARMSTTNMMFNDQRARDELGHSPRPASEAFVDSARWFVENGYVSTKRAARIRFPELTPARLRGPQADAASKPRTVGITSWTRCVHRTDRRRPRPKSAEADDHPCHRSRRWPHTAVRTGLAGRRVDPRSGAVILGR